MAVLEGGERALLFSTGMAAITTTTDFFHAIIRLDSLYRDFFAPPPERPPEPVPPEKRLNFEELSG